MSCVCEPILSIMS